MNLATRSTSKLDRKNVRWLFFGALFAAIVLMASAYAHAQSGAPPERLAANDRDTAREVSYPPNYALEARFLPESMNKLVFDLSVTPHWFTLSDRFWYRYQTTDGAKYYIVDPLKKTKSLLWDNAKVAAALSSLTGFPYDAQHLPIRRLKLVDKDTKMRFEVEIRKDGVVPNEEKKQEDANQQGNETETTQNQQQQGQQQGQQQEQRGRRGQQQQAGPGAGAEPPEDTRTLTFEYELATGRVTRLDKFEAEPKKPMWASVSPSEALVVFARGHNLYIMDAENYAKAKKKAGDTSIVETQLTTDGVEKFSYARELLPEQQEQLVKDDKGDTNKVGIRTVPITIHWSKDSKKIALVREDNRKVGMLWVIHSLSKPRPTLESYSYPMPGEDNIPIPQLEVIDIASKATTVVQAKNYPQQEINIVDAPITEREREEQREEQERNRDAQMGGPRTTARWVSETSDKLYFTATHRDYRRAAVCVADASNGTVKTLFEERSNTWISLKALRLVNNGQGIVWWSERDGWGHYYLYDADGKLKNQITSGEFVTDQIVGLDEKTRTLFFTANGREQNEDPYYIHLYRVNLDGSGFKLLTGGNFSHAPAAADSSKYFVDTYSRVDVAPKSVLVDEQGTALVELETADLSQLFAAGYKFPEMFKVKADDGITDLYGVMYKPFDFDPNRKYPLIEYVYPGPQVEQVTKAFTPKGPNVPLAQLGFIVIEVGARGGSPQRNKWYDTYGYGNLRDYGLADKKAAAEHLGALHPYIDLNRVGMWGHSGGGFMTAAALMQYPDFFKAGWSESGNHDNNVYNRDWSEKYHGVREEVQKDGTSKFIYEIDKNSDLAKNLQGHLMLTTGDMDNNVSMVNTMHLADTLIKANKRFEMLVLPGMRHSYMPINPWVTVARGDFFSHWLLGSSASTADIPELQGGRQATPSKKFKE